jgi:hypothetical protein
MLPLIKHIICRGQEFDVSDGEAGFFEDFPGGRGGEGFAVLEVTAGELVSA